MPRPQSAPAQATGYPSVGPPMVVQPRRAAPTDAARSTRAEVDLARVRHNYRELVDGLRADARKAQRSAAAVWGVLKADGYGHGAAAVANALQHAGIDGLCVALLEEGIELRHAGIVKPILILGGYWGRHRDGVEALIEHRLTPVVYHPGQLQRLANTARYMHAAAQGVHLKVDTGMGRLGASPADLSALALTIAQEPLLKLDALMTHLACADETGFETSEQQLALFATAREALLRGGRNTNIMTHAANSAALLRMPAAQCDITRPGIALFGVNPCPTHDSRSARRANLKPAMRVLSEVVALRDIRAGQAIGYGHRWRAARDSCIATIPMGYADGLSRMLSGRGALLLGGKRAPIVGAISMDLTMVDVTDHPGVNLRDEVVILGEQRGRLGEDTIDAHEMADLSGTIPWECLTSISRRVPRFYRNA